MKKAWFKTQFWQCLYISTNSWNLVSHLTFEFEISTKCRVVNPHCAHLATTSPDLCVTMVCESGKWEKGRKECVRGSGVMETLMMRRFEMGKRSQNAEDQIGMLHLMHCFALQVWHMADSQECAHLPLTQMPCWRGPSWSCWPCGPQQTILGHSGW